jgi:hypothetical protein
MNVGAPTTRRSSMQNSTRLLLWQPSSFPCVQLKVEIGTPTGIPVESSPFSELERDRLARKLIDLHSAKRCSASLVRGAIQPPSIVCRNWRRRVTVQLANSPLPARPPNSITSKRQTNTIVGVWPKCGRGKAAEGIRIRRNDWHTMETSDRRDWTGERSIHVGWPAWPFACVALCKVRIDLAV